MKLEELDNEWKIAAMIEGDIEDAKYVVGKLVAAAKAAMAHVEYQDRIGMAVEQTSLDLKQALEDLEGQE